MDTPYAAVDPDFCQCICTRYTPFHDQKGNVYPGEFGNCGCSYGPDTHEYMDSDGSGCYEVEAPCPATRCGNNCCPDGCDPENPTGCYSKGVDTDRCFDAAHCCQEGKHAVECVYDWGVCQASADNGGLPGQLCCETSELPSNPHDANKKCEPWGAS